MTSTPAPFLTSTLTLEKINHDALADVRQALDGLYEHSPWVLAQALRSRPFRTLAQLKFALAQAVNNAGPDAQVALIRAHSELTGKAASTPLAPSAQSAQEQHTAGLAHCSPAEAAQLQQLNGDYRARFGFPCVLAVRGPRGNGLSRTDIISTLARRLQHPPAFELAENLRSIHRIAELRLNDQLGVCPTAGDAVWDWHEQLAQFSDPGFAEHGQLTVTYLTDAHRACAQFIGGTMRNSGFDAVSTDAVGNVVGLYKSDQPGAKTLLTGSHYDTVRNGGKYDGRLGIFVPMVCVQALHQRGQRLPFHLEVVGFAEEEGQRYKATFLGSGALTGDFKAAWLAQRDADGISMQQAMQHAGMGVGLSAEAMLAGIASLKRNPADYLGFVELHIEQGPVLNELNLPLGVVTSINGNVRYVGEVTGMASHAGTTPMNRRRDAATAVAELALFIEQRAARDGDSVGTIGMLQVPGGSINVVPGRCTFSLDLRAPHDTQRDVLEADVLAALQAICQRRGVSYTVELTERAVTIVPTNDINALQGAIHVFNALYVQNTLHQQITTSRIKDIAHACPNVGHCKGRTNTSLVLGSVSFKLNRRSSLENCAKCQNQQRARHRTQIEEAQGAFWPKLKLKSVSQQLHRKVNSCSYPRLFTDARIWHHLFQSFNSKKQYNM